MKRPHIVNRIAEAMHRAEPTASTWVYGSEARGDARPDSDIDLLILLDEPELTPEREWSVRCVLTGLEVESGVAINALVMLRRMWEGLATPFALRVNQEGVLL